MAIAEIKKYNGYPALVIDGKVYPPMTATISNNREGKVKIDKEYYRALGDSGIKIFFLICDSLWLIPDSLEVFKKEAEILLEVCPDAYIIPRISVHPPESWMKEHPDDMVTYSDRSRVETELVTETFKRTTDCMYSLASQNWRRDAGKALMDTVYEIDKLPFADRIAGYFLAAGGTSEWYYINPIEDLETGVYADTSKAFREQFQKYLDDKYGKGKVKADIPDAKSRFFSSEVDRLIANIPEISPVAPVPPPPSNSTNYGSFLDVNKYMHTFDFYRAWNIATAESIIYFAKLLKEHDPHKIVGSFYGAWGWIEPIWRSNTGGVNRILNSGYVDMLANPGVYENRQPGGFTGQRQMTDSFRLHNAIYMVEEDTRTHAENSYYADLFGMFDMNDTINVLKRDFGRNICEDLQAWWFDQHWGGGRYKFPEVYRLFARQQEIAREAYEKDRRKGSEIAFIFDEQSGQAVSMQTTLETVELIRNREIARIGAPVDQYYHDDMLNPDMPDYKLYVFMNTFYLSDGEREAIRTKLRKNGATAMFVYASGLINPDKKVPLDIKNVSEFTGINCNAVTERFTPKFSVVKGSHPLADALKEGRIYGYVDRPEHNNLTVMPRHPVASYLYPMVYADDKDAAVIAEFKANGLPAVAIKQQDGFTSVFYGAKYVNADFLREVARYAGCHIYEEDGNVLYASRNYITIHASKTGRINIRLPEKSDVFEVYEEKYYGKGTDTVSLDMIFGETKMFCISKADKSRPDFNG